MLSLFSRRFAIAVHFLSDFRTEVLLLPRGFVVTAHVHCLLSDTVVLLHVPHDRDVGAQWCTDTARVVDLDPGRHS